MIISLALKELKNSRKFTFGFILTLSLGLWSLNLLSSFKFSFNQLISSKAKELLTSDIALFSTNSLKDEDYKKLEKILINHYADKNQIIEVYSMAKSRQNSRLTELRIVESNYPFYGHLKLKNNLLNSKDLNNPENPIAFLSPELKEQMKINIGEKFKVGCQEFTFADMIEDDSASSWRGVSLAPRIYIGNIHLSKMCLTGFGSTAHYAYSYKLKNDSNLQELSKKLENEFDDPTIRIVIPEKTSEQVARVLNYLTDYLGLVALSAIFLSCIGAIYLFRAFILKRIKDLAILKSIGLGHKKIKMKFYFQILSLAISSWAVSLLLTMITLPILQWLLASKFNLILELNLSWQVGLISFLIATILAFLMIYPILEDLISIRASQLFQELRGIESKFSLKSVLKYIPALLFFWTVSMAQASSIKIGSIYFVLFIGSFSIMLLILLKLFKFFSKKLHSESLSLLIAESYLFRNPMSSISTFLSLTMGVMLFTLVGQIETGLKKELSFSNLKNTPSLFLFDIQEDQAEELNKLITDHQKKLNSLSPMVRSRLIKINDKVVEKEKEEFIETREMQTRRRFRNRGINLSYRNFLNPSENLVKGTLAKETYQESTTRLPEISLEERYAQRLEIKLGDSMTFDILDVEIKGIVTSLRSIKWTSFEPNFFIIFQPGVLEMAPKTFLASMTDLNFEEKNSIQNLVVDKFPNISIVDIEKVVGRVLGIFSHMSKALSIMGIFCILVGFVVLISIVTSQLTSRQKDLILLKALGVSFSSINKALYLEFITIIGASFFTGILISIFSSWIVANEFFDSAWGINYFNISISFVSFLIISIIVVKISSYRILKIKAKEILN